MADITIKEENLIINIKDIRKIFSLENKLTIPLAHIKGVSADENGWENRASFPAIRVGGTSTPFYKGGRFLVEGNKIFYDFKKGEQAIVLMLADDKFQKLIIGVDDAQAVVSQIEQALNDRSN